MIKSLKFNFGGVLPTLFYFFAFFSLLPQQARWAGMFSIIGLCGLVSFFNLNFYFKRRFLIYLLFISFIIVSTYFHNSLHPAFSEYAFNKRNYFFFVFISCALILPFFISQKDNAEQMIYYLVIFSVIMTVFAFIDGGGSNSRVRGVELNPALHSKLVFFAGMYFLSLKISPLKAPFLTGLTILGCAACLFTASRGSLMAFFIVGFLLYAVEMRPVKLLQAIIIAVVSSFIFYQLLPYLPIEIAERFDLETLLESQRSEGNRLFLYTLSYEIIMNNLGGIGVGNMSNYFWINAPHNIILEIIMDVGFILAMPFLFLLLWALKRSFSAAKSPYFVHRFFAIFFWFSFINSLIGGELSLPSSLLYLPLGYLIVGYQPYKMKQPYHYRKDFYHNNIQSAV